MIDNSPTEAEDIEADTNYINASYIDVNKYFFIF